MTPRPGISLQDGDRRRSDPWEMEPVGCRACILCKHVPSPTSALESPSFSGGSSVLLGVWKGLFLESKGLLSPCWEFLPASVSRPPTPLDKLEEAEELSLGQSSCFALALSPRLSHWRHSLPSSFLCFPVSAEPVRTAQRGLHRPLRGAEKIGTSAEVVTVQWHKTFFHLKKSIF